MGRPIHGAAGGDQHRAGARPGLAPAGGAGRGMGGGPHRHVVARLRAGRPAAQGPGRRGPGVHVAGQPAPAPLGRGRADGAGGRGRRPRALV
ncbi:MAG: hypothetical protein FJW99_02785 [Actinobacteria bacterium]|nr:hypothetical protein [Actinomycetota bacterium]